VAPTADALEHTRSVSDPRAPGYDPKSPYYDVTADSSSTYYVGPLATDSPSGDAIRAQVTAQVDQEIAGHTSWLSKIIDPLIRDRKIQDLYEKRVADARQQLHDRVDLRSPGGAPSTVWANASHEQMNAAISQNANSATVAQASEEWVSVGNELAEHQRNLAGAISASTANWQGSGGDAAREHLANVGKWLGSTAQGAMLTGRQQEIHSQTLNETQRLMAANPPVAFSVQDANARLQQITDPAQYAAQAQQDMQTYKTQQAARGQAARVMTDFDNTVGSAVATPVFAPPPKLPGMTARTAGTNAGSAAPGAQTQPATPAGATPAQGRVPALPAAGTGGSGVTGGVGSPGGTAAPYGSGVPGSPGGPSGDAVHGSGGPGSGGYGSGGPGSGGYGSGGPGGGSLAAARFSGAGSVGTPGGVPPLYDSTSAAGYTPPTSHPGAPGFHVPPLSDGTTRGGSPYTGAGPGSGPSIPGGSPAGFTPGLGGGSGTGSGSGSGRIPTIGRSGGVNGDSIGSRLMGGSGSVPGGAGASGAAGAGAGAGARLPGGGGAAAGGRGIGGFPGGSGSSLAAGSSSGAAGAAAAAEAEAAAGRSAAGAGRGTTTPGMGGMGGARGNGDEDKEHRLADYLEPEDPSIFAADEVAAPPVIGDWKNTDWK
jgi:hypothetical protein